LISKAKADEKLILQTLVILSFVVFFRGRPSITYAREMNSAIKHLAQKISIRTNEPYPKVVGVLRCRLSFEMLRSVLVCLRGSRSIKPKIFDMSSEEIQNSSAYVVTEDAKLH